MIFQDELGFGGPASKSWHRMVEGHDLRAEVVNNAFATVPTHRKRFINHRKEVRERETRGNCVAPSLRAPFLFWSFGIFFENVTKYPSSSWELQGPQAGRDPDLGNYRIAKIKETARLEVVLGI